MRPDERLFRVHLEEAPFLCGADIGKWALHGELGDILWPNATLWVAADSQVYPPGRVYLRFDLTEYPSTAPTACPWNIQANTRLEDGAWPKLNGKFMRVFRHDWHIRNALYAPCDRLAMKDHESWKQQFPAWWWQPSFTIVKYLAFIHLCLNPNRL